MSDKPYINSSGVGFTGLLAVAFIVLKLTHVISWSWWWVLAPLWIPVSIALLLLFILFFFIAIDVIKY